MGRLERQINTEVATATTGGIFSQGMALLPHTKSLPSTVVAKCNFFSSILIEVSLGGVFSMLPH